MAKISIVIPTPCDAQNTSMLKHALSSLVKHKDPKHEYELIVVANAWEGFSVPVNRGIKMATGEYVLVMNDDVEIAGAGWEDLMLAQFSEDVGIVGHAKTVQHGKYSALWFTLVKKDVFDEIGLLDEDLNLYSQDIMFGFKAMKEGIKTAFVQLPVNHGWSRTTSRLERNEDLKAEAKAIFKAKTGIDHDLA